MNFLNKQWYSFNDSSVDPTTEASCVKSSAYVLFYRRRTPGQWYPGSGIAVAPAEGEDAAATSGGGSGGSPNSASASVGGAGVRSYLPHDEDLDKLD